MNINRWCKWNHNVCGADAAERQTSLARRASLSPMPALFRILSYPGFLSNLMSSFGKEDQDNQCSSHWNARMWQRGRKILGLRTLRIITELILPKWKPLRSPKGVQPSAHWTSLGCNADLPGPGVIMIQVTSTHWVSSCPPSDLWVPRAGWTRKRHSKVLCEYSDSTLWRFWEIQRYSVELSSQSRAPGSWKSAPCSGLLSSAFTLTIQVRKNFMWGDPHPALLPTPHYLAQWAVNPLSWPCLSSCSVCGPGRQTQQLSVSKGLRQTTTLSCTGDSNSVGKDGAVWLLQHQGHAPKHLITGKTANSQGSQGDSLVPG